MRSALPVVVQLIDFEFPTITSPFSAGPGIVRQNRRFSVRRCFDCDGRTYARGVVGGPKAVIFEHQAPLMLSDDELQCIEICERVWVLLDERQRGEVLEVIVQSGEVTVAGDQSFSIDLMKAAESTIDRGAEPNQPASASP